MGLSKKLGMLDEKSRIKVYVSTFYNLVGYFDDTKQSKTITKKIFEEFVEENVARISNR